MFFHVKVRVKLSTMAEFGQKLQTNELNRSCIRGETYCFKDDPAVGVSIWEAASHQEFESKFGPWRAYYDEVEVKEVITPAEAMVSLFHQMKK